MAASLAWIVGLTVVFSWLAFNAYRRP